MLWDDVADAGLINTGSPWDEDKAMMSRWGLDGMQSFEQVSVARKEGVAGPSEAVPPAGEAPRETSQEQLMRASVSST